jgi:CRP-like cAMP-binding protein
VPRRGRESLAQVPLFTELSPRHMKRVGDLMEEQRYMDGATVVREGDIGDTFYVIREGEAKVVTRSGRVVNRLRPGDFFGEISLLDGGPRTASVVAETPLTMLALTRNAFLRLVRDEPAVAVGLLTYAARLLRRMERSKTANSM